MTNTATKPQAANTSQTNDLVIPAHTQQNSDQKDKNASKLYSPQLMPTSQNGNNGYIMNITDSSSTSGTKTIRLSQEDSHTYYLLDKLQYYNELKTKQDANTSLTPQETKELNTLEVFIYDYDTKNDKSLKSIFNSAVSRENAISSVIEMKSLLQNNKTYYSPATGSPAPVIVKDPRYYELEKIAYNYCLSNNLDYNKFTNDALKLSSSIIKTIHEDNTITFDWKKLLRLSIFQELDYLAQNKGKLIPATSTLTQISTPVFKQLYENCQDDKLKLIPRNVTPYAISILNKLLDTAAENHYPHQTGTINLLKEKFLHPDGDFKIRFDQLLKDTNNSPTRYQITFFTENELRRTSTNPNIEQRATEKKDLYIKALNQASSKASATKLKELQSYSPDSTVPTAMNLIQNTLSNSTTETLTSLDNNNTTALLSLLSENSGIAMDKIRNKFTENTIFFKSYVDGDRYVDLPQLELINKEYPNQYKIAENYLNTNDKATFITIVSYLETLSESKEELSKMQQLVAFSDGIPEKVNFNKRIISGDTDAIEQLRPYFDKTKTDAENIQIFQLNARDQKIHLDSEENSAQDTIDYVKHNNLIQYIKPGLEIAGLKMLRMLGADNVQATINEINKGADDAINMIDGKATKFIARFIKKNAADIVLISAAFATGGTAIAPALAQLEGIYGTAQKIQQIQETYRELKAENLPPEQLARKMTEALISFGISDYVNSEIAGAFAKAITPYLGENIAENGTKFGILTIENILSNKK